MSNANQITGRYLTALKRPTRDEYRRIYNIAARVSQMSYDAANETGASETWAQLNRRIGARYWRIARYVLRRAQLAR
jgi:hypothetical protein